jgi:hypothetical protein
MMMVKNLTIVTVITMTVLMGATVVTAPVATVVTMTDLMGATVVTAPVATVVHFRARSDG